MRILSSGLLLGAGTVSIVVGVKTASGPVAFNPFVILGLCLMSLGLFALRVNAEPEDDPVEDESAVRDTANQHIRNRLQEFQSAD